MVSCADENRTLRPGDAQRAMLAGFSVLVVEDEYFLADDIARALRSHGAEVVGPAGEAEEALGLIRARPDIDVAILDINLRGEMIYPVGDALRRDKIPFVLATGYDDAAIRPDYREVPRWEKPFDPEALVRALPGLV